MRNVMLMESAVGRALRATTSAFRRDDPARKWCLRHRRDNHRVAPLELNVNDQSAIKVRPPGKIAIWASVWGRAVETATLLMYITIRGMR